MCQNHMIVYNNVSLLHFYRFLCSINMSKGKRIMTLVIFLLFKNNILFTTNVKKE